MPPLTFSKSADGPGFLKKDATRLKQDLALKLLSKGLFYIRAMLAGISDTPPRRIDFNQRKFKKTWQGRWTDIDDEMERTLFHYSFDGKSFQYNDISPPLIPGTLGFFRRELT